MKRTSVLLLVLGMMVTMLSSCGNSSSPESDTPVPEAKAAETDADDSVSEGLVTIRAASLSKESALPYYIIHEKGWDVENGFEIDLSAYDSGALVNEALGAGLWDTAAIGAAAVSSMAKYDCIQLMQFQDVGTGIGAIVRTDSDILDVQGYNPGFPDVYGSPETVEGATILVAVGSGNHMQISAWLQALGLTDEDVNLVHMEFAQAWQAFNSGEGDIFSTTYPYTLYALEEGYVFASDFETLDVEYGNNIICTREFYEENAEILVPLLQQIIRANDELKDLDAAADWAQKWYQVNGNDVDYETAYENMSVLNNFGTEEVTAEDFNNSAMIKAQAEFSYNTGAITEDEYQQVLENIDVSIFDKAVAGLK